MLGLAEPDTTSLFESFAAISASILSEYLRTIRGAVTATPSLYGQLVPAAMACRKSSDLIYSSTGFAPSIEAKTTSNTVEAP